MDNVEEDQQLIRDDTSPESENYLNHSFNKKSTTKGVREGDENISSEGLGRQKE